MPRAFGEPSAIRACGEHTRILVDPRRATIVLVAEHRLLNAKLVAFTLLVQHADVAVQTELLLDRR